MADLEGRDGFEASLARALGRLNRQQSAELLEYLGDPPNMANVPPEFWDGSAQAMSGVLATHGEQVYLAAAEAMLDTVPIGVEWGLVNESAVTWSRQYSYGMVRDITDTSRRALQDAVSGFYERPTTMGELRERIGRIYSPVRADMIASTEVTRAAAQGELDIVREIEKHGFRMVAIWQTNNDEIVRRCPICMPRHDQPQGEAWQDPPPAHPRCRCWINHEFATEGAA